MTAKEEFKTKIFLLGFTLEHGAERTYNLGSIKVILFPTVISIYYMEQITKRRKNKTVPLNNHDKAYALILERLENQEDKIPI